MKVFKFALLVALFSVLSIGQTQAQEKSKNQSYSIHDDFIKPSMVGEYEKLALEFIDLAKQYQLEDNYLVVTDDEFQYSYVSAIDNMADLDKGLFDGISDQAVKDKFFDVFDRMDKCYDVHGNRIITLLNELSYMPDGMSTTQEGLDYRTWHKFYVTPENRESFVEKAKAIKGLYERKNSKRHYRIYSSGFGVSDAYFLVAVSSKDAIDSAQKDKENGELLGPERKQFMSDIMKYTSKYEVKNGWIRRDLSYSSGK